MALGGFPVDICLPPTTYFILVDVQPLGRLRIFVCFPFLYFTYVPGLSVPSALLRILGVGVIDLFPFAVSVCLMASFIISSLQGIWGSPDSPLYLFSTFVTICNFSLCRHWVIRASEGEAVCLIDSSINLGLSMSQTVMQASAQGTVGTTFT